MPPRAFAVEDIVMNVSAAYWKDNPDNILSCLIHELGHVGHSWCREASGRDDGLTEGHLCSMLYGLQGEGFCVYVAYGARRQFPAPDEVDFRLYEDPAEVRRLMDVFSEVLNAELPDAELQKLAWEKCVQDRGFYIAGMHCCDTIVETHGRDALIRTLGEGPLSFVKLYNEAAPAEMRIRLPAPLVRA